MRRDDLSLENFKSVQWQRERSDVHDAFKQGASCCVFRSVGACWRVAQRIPAFSLRQQVVCAYQLICIYK